MYNLSYFKENDRDAVLDFIHNHPFAFVAGADENGKPVATQLPLFIEERSGNLYLSGHMMKNTDHHKAFVRNPATLCVFTGAHSYVSATWYTNPNQASTWNYMSVHLLGNMSFLDEAALIEILRKTSLHFEGGDTASPTAYDNLPDDYRSKLVKAIVAFEIEVAEMDNVFKLSQNRDEKSYGNIIEKLKDGNAEAIAVAEEMEARTPLLFPGKEVQREQ